MEGQAPHSDCTGPTSMEFQSQDTKVAKDDDKGTHSAGDDEVSKQQTQSKVWGTGPTRRSECIGNKVLITKMNSKTPDIKTPRNYEDMVNSPERKLWKM